MAGRAGDGARRGGLVRASAAYHRSEDVPGRAWGLYMDPFWAPTWPSRMLPWENMALPVDFDEAVEAIDEYTLQFTFTEPLASFLSNLAGVWRTPASPAAIEEYGADAGTHPVGTGPFKFVEWVPQSHILVERNPDYAWAPEGFHNGPSYLDGMVAKLALRKKLAGICRVGAPLCCAWMASPRWTCCCRLWVWSSMATRSPPCGPWCWARTGPC